MSVGLWHVGIALVLLALNLLIYMSSYGRTCEQAKGARIFAVLGFISFIVASFAVGDIAAHACIFPRERWPTDVLDLSSTGLLGSTLGATWFWLMSR